MRSLFLSSSANELSSFRFSCLRALFVKASPPDRRLPGTTPRYFTSSAWGWLFQRRFPRAIPGALWNCEAYALPFSIADPAWMVLQTEKPSAWSRAKTKCRAEKYREAASGYAPTHARFNFSRCPNFISYLTKRYLFFCAES